MSRLYALFAGGVAAWALTTGLHQVPFAWLLVGILSSSLPWPAGSHAMISASSTLENVRDAAKFGVIGFLVKPFTADKVLEILKATEPSS
jgi:hypothetical protein